MSGGTPLPRLTPETGFFWTSGRTGRLSVMRCQSCGFWLHPPTPQCRCCRSADLTPEAVSGRAVLWSATTSHQKLLPEVEVPYTVAIVALEEQEGLHLTTRLVDIAPDEVQIGMPLEVRFELHDEIALPLFGPAVS